MFSDSDLYHNNKVEQRHNSLYYCYSYTRSCLISFNCTPFIEISALSLLLTISLQEMLYYEYATVEDLLYFASTWSEASLLCGGCHVVLYDL